MQEIVFHEFEPVYDKNSTILILGSIPSLKSREEGFYYGHPKNRFWQKITKVYDDEIPKSIEEKKAFLYRHHIALWDVIASCKIHKSSDSSIKNVIANDINIILNNSKVTKIFTLGKTATSLYQKYCYPKTKVESIYLPSTSPANCKIKDEELLSQFMITRV